MIINTFKSCTDEIKCNLYKKYILIFFSISYEVVTLKQFSTNSRWRIIIHLEFSLILIGYAMLVLR